MTTPPDTATKPTVVKLGGSTLGAHDTSLHDIAAARREGVPLVIVHGGGAAVSEWLARSGIKARFVRGLRVTDDATLDVVVAVLAGLVNKQLVAQLSALGAPAIGLSGADSLILQARRYDEELGAVGQIVRVNPFPIEELLQLGYVPVIAPIAADTEGAGRRGGLLNTNADTAAGEIATALRASRLVFLTDVEGVLNANSALIRSLEARNIQTLVDSGVVSGGMIPKLESAARAALAGCTTNIADGTAAGALSALLRGEELGTRVS